MLTKNVTNNLTLLGVLSVEQLVHLCVHAAKSVLHVWEDKYPNDKRPKEAIEAAECWLRLGSHFYTVRAEHFGAKAHQAAFDYSYACNAARAAAYTGYVPICGSVQDASYAVYYVLQTDSQELHWLNNLYYAILGKPQFPESWKTCDTVSIAKDMLASKNFKDMPILADALEDAGCTDAEVLSHLRTDRGVWCSGDWVLMNLRVKK